MNGVVTITLATLLIIPVIITVVFWPFAIVWALNYLFSLQLEYSFFSWLAVLVLFISFGSVTKYKN